jgi:RNA polymerase sigma-70 factor (ECF subfamily)
MAEAPRPPEVPQLVDEDLIVLVGRGHPAAFEVLYERHVRVAFSLAFRLMGDREGAEDLVQDAYLAVWRGSASYAPARGSVRNWLLAILHSRGVDRLRTGAAMSRRQEALKQVALRGPGHPDVADQGMGRALAGAVRRGLKELPDEQGTVLNLAYFGGFTHQEIAQMLELPLGTVKSRMRLGLQRLRRGLGELEAAAT